jgi:hypothetical protein
MWMAFKGVQSEQCVFGGHFLRAAYISGGDLYQDLGGYPWRLMSTFHSVVLYHLRFVEH